MKHLTRFLLSLLCLGASFALLPGQAAFVATGANSDEGATQLSLSVGQLTFLHFSAPGGVVAQGVQQPFFVVSVEDVNALPFNCSLYPNPTAADLTLKVSELPVPDLTFRLYDLNGRTLASGPVADLETRIPTASLRPATYFLLVNDGRGGSLSFKIVKTQ